MTGNTQVIWVRSEAKYFCKRGWTQHRVICPAGTHVILRSAPLRASRRMDATHGLAAILRDAAKTLLLRMTSEIASKALRMTAVTSVAWISLRSIQATRDA
jgi:hypothetical protein